MHEFEGPKETVDQISLRSSYLEEYPETTAPPEKKLPKPKTKPKAKAKEKKTKTTK